RGIASGTAVFAASMIGPMQVAGRLVMLAFERRVSSLRIFAGCFVVMMAASFSLFGTTLLSAFLVVFIVLQGSGYGATSILRPVVTAEILGRKNFGLIAGFLAIPFLVASALAPTIAALIWQAGGYDIVIWFAAGAALVGLVSLLIAASSAKRASS
ncbi:MAG: MFS transporter, partial [Chloroflexota bacterium]